MHSIDNSKWVVIIYTHKEIVKTQQRGRKKYKQYNEETLAHSRAYRNRWLNPNIPFIFSKIIF